MSLANKLSLFRILLVPAFVVCLLYYREGVSDWLRWLAAGFFVVGALTDAVDGYVARAERQATRLGAILDPAADKLFLVTAFLCLSLISTLPPSMRFQPWVLVLVFTRDALIVLGWLLIVLVTGDLRAQPSKLGKATTFFQMFAVLAALFGWPLAPVLWTAMGLTVLSGIGYLRYANRVLNFAGVPPSRPTSGAG